MVDDRFDGEIAGFGTDSGTRIVIGRWVCSPYGAFADAMVERPNGHRVLVVPDGGIATYVTSIYTFDEVVVTAVACVREAATLRFRGGPLSAELVIGRRRPLGWVLQAIPRRLAVSPAWASMVDPVARRVLPGVRTRSSTPGGEEAYGAVDCRRVDSILASWCGEDLGAIRDVDPPVRFGAGSTPRRPSIVTLTTTVRRR